jgi:hypothetical protein
MLVSFVIIGAFSNPTKAIPTQKLPTDTLAAERQRYIDEILNSLKGREGIPADSVFKNLQTFTGAPQV